MQISINYYYCYFFISREEGLYFAPSLYQKFVNLLPAVSALFASQGV